MNQQTELDPNNSNTHFVYPPRHTETPIETDIKDPKKAEI